MNRRNFLKTVPGTIYGVMYALLLSSRRLLRPASVRKKILFNCHQFGEKNSFRFMIGKIDFRGKWLKWNDPATVVYTNQGWVPLNEVQGKLNYYGLSGHTVSCYCHPELACTEMPEEIAKIVRGETV